MATLRDIFIKPNPQDFTLRPYQDQIITEVDAHIADGIKQIMIQSATGSGKSKLFTFLTRRAVDQGKNVLICVHRKELLNQAVRHMKSTGLIAGVIQGSRTMMLGSPVQVASVPTMHKRLNIKWKPDFIFMDEAHHSGSTTWVKIQEAYPDAILIGFTATPIDSKQKGFVHIYKVMVKGPKVKDLIRQGHLSNFKIYGAPPIDVRGVKKGANGDYNSRDLEEVADKPKLIADLVDTWRQLALGEKTIVFACSPKHSEHVRDQYNEFGRSYYGKEIAAHIDGTTPEGERDEIVRRFSLTPNDPDNLMLLTNYGVAAEGFDVPSCSCVQLARPTMSLALALQMYGRSLRPAPGKEYAKLLDHAGVITMHGKPDADHEWSLESGVIKADSTDIQCPCCGAINERSKVLPQICDVCKAIIVIGADKKSRSRFDRADITLDEDTELVELNYTDNEFALMGLISKAKSKARDPEKIPKGRIVAQFLELNPSYPELCTAANLLGYRRGWALHQWEALESKVAV
jgi:DNA repair protein RadD